jgi:beta-lactamase class C
MTDFLNDFTPLYAPGTFWSYSNPGFALLGLAISNVLSGGSPGTIAAGGAWPAGYRSFAAQVVRHVCQPLGLHSTMVNYPSVASHVVEGNTQNTSGTGYRSVAPPSWALGSAALAAGALCSTPSDMLNFLDAHMGFTENRTLKAALGLAIAPASPGNSLEMGLGWQIAGTLNGGSESDAYYDKNGGIPGYDSYMAFDRQRQWGIVVLSNSAGSNFGNELTTAGRVALGRLRGLTTPTAHFPHPAHPPTCP